MSAQDTTIPSCAITAPTPNSSVSGITVLQATASDDVAVASVQFLINFELHGVADFSSPYDAVWNTFPEVQGPAFISAIATDTSGNQAIADPVLVFIDNQTSTGNSCALRFSENDGGVDDHAKLESLPSGFGAGEFTFEMWIKPQQLYPIGPTSTGGAGQLINWSAEDFTPYSSATWWETGNLLVDGRNLSAPKDGSFALQMYGGGRLRWLFGDGSANPNGGLWVAQAANTNDAPSLLDGAWHSVAVVRRWASGGGADLELWIDGELIGSETTPLQTDMTNWWATWLGFPAGEGNWIMGAHKAAALGTIAQHEDYKGLVDLMRFWNRAKSPAELSFGHRFGVTESEAGLASLYQFDECSGTTVGDTLSAGGNINLVDMPGGAWAGDDAPAIPVDDLAPELRSELLSDGSLRLILLGAPGKPHDLVGGSVLGSWQSLTSFTFDRSVYEYIDPSAVSGDVGFYRLDRLSAAP